LPGWRSMRSGVTICPHDRHKIVRAKSNPKLGTEGHEPDKAHSDHRDTYADDK
jgi:hypothetical protein